MPRRLFCLTAVLGILTISAQAEDLPPPPQTAGIAIPDGQIERAVGEVDAIVAGIMERTGIPGLAVAVVSKDKVLFLKGYGVRKAGAPEKVDADTVFQLASLSKSIGATVVAHEVGEGVVHWDTPMTELLPWFKLASPQVTALLTVGDLYAHRSGLPDHAGDDLEDLGFSRQQILERLSQEPLSAFRTHYAYTNFGLTAAAQAVAEAAGTDWDSLSAEVLYKPLGMESTSSRFSDFMARENRAYPHVRIGDAWDSVFQRKPDAQTPAGGVSSSAADMARWMQMVLGMGEYEGKRIVAAEALLPALSPQAVSSRPYAPDARAGFYGYGFGVGVSPAGRVMISHSGGFLLGAGTNYVLLPSADIGIAVLTNAQPIGAAEAVGMSFMDMVQYGKIRRDWLPMYGELMKPAFQPVGKHAGEEAPDATTPPRPLADYSGTYANAYFGDLTVKPSGESLVMQLKDSGASFSLEHWTGDEFVFRPQNENAPEGSISSVFFQIGEGGKPERVSVEYFNESGNGDFTRR
ncbi:serine hydrolase [Nitratireductor indicus]|uniref:serine hydrolase n=1 Tax=Nitratireductor indicus TaxID=721133 RepID=UPI000314A731|nr:serine hydrolase [Nitratireductor indicus]SFQ46851.1 CubicO group peptidase, beta-lactamase class C family [Nitratireductor indicus]